MSGSFASVTERFLRYVAVNTRSDEASEQIPSTDGQKKLAQLLAEECRTLGLTDVTIDDVSVVMATLPANTDKQISVIGFIAHMDTADYEAEGIRPQIIRNYDGGIIRLNDHDVLDPQQFPDLRHYVGQDLITTDGTTLLGADDKSGIAEIMTAMAYLMDHPEIQHGKVRIAFSIDEEIGRGAHHFNVKAFGCDFAYTVDGGPLGELEYESFNAAGAQVTVRGVSVHPGSAKDKMINAGYIATQYAQMLPHEEVPEKTEDNQGFYCLMEMNGDIESATLTYIIRDHRKDLFEQRKQLMKQLAEKLNYEYGTDCVRVTIRDQYYNMREIIEQHMEIVTLAQEAMKDAGVKPLIVPIRGGTDGSILSFRGLPTPNLFAGGENFHGKYEFVSIQTMEKAAEVIARIIERAA